MILLRVSWSYDVIYCEITELKFAENCWIYAKNRHSDKHEYRIIRDRKSYRSFKSRLKV